MSNVAEFWNLHFTASNSVIMPRKQAEIFFCAQTESKVDQSTIPRWFKKFYSGRKKLDDQAKSGQSKSMDSETPN